MDGFTRRETLAAGAALACAAAASAQPRSAPLAELDATATANLIRRREITPLEAVDAAIVRAEALQPRLNFMVTPDYERARDRARRGRLKGPFAGAPFLIKDLNDVVGLPTYSGSRVNLKNPPAKAQSPYIDAFEAAGLVFLGKSATPEYGFLPTTEPVAFGPTHNPWNLGRSSGGSSGGSAAAVAAHVVPFAHANDGGGSIRIPASCCGLFGLKPSRGRMISADDRPAPRAPARARRSIDLGVEHCLSRSVRDSAALFAITERTGRGAAFPPIGFVAGPSRRRLRVGLVMQTVNGQAPSGPVQAAVERTAERLRALGHSVRETRWPLGGGDFTRDFLLLWGEGASELVHGVTQKLGRPPDDRLLEPFTLGLAEFFDKQPGVAFEAAVDRLRSVTPRYSAWLTEFDVILSPVLTLPPPELGWIAPTVPFDELTERLIRYVGYTPLHNVAGAPAMSVPAGWTDDGLPIGAHFAGPIGGERTLFELAYELEQAQPWVGRKPPVSA